MECGCETNIQEVSLRGETPATVDTLVITADGSDSMSFEWKDDFVVMSAKGEERINLMVRDILSNVYVQFSQSILLSSLSLLLFLLLDDRTRRLYG